MIVYGHLSDNNITMRINGRTFYSIWKDSQNFRIIIYGESGNNALFLKDKLGLMDVEVDYIITDNGISGKETCGIRNVYDLLYEKFDEIMVVVIKDDYSHAYDILSGIGLKPGDDFKWINRYGFENINAKYAFDPTLGCNYIGANSEYPGFTIYGDIEDSNAVRIVTLGGSTSDPTLYYFKNWSELLYEKLNDFGINAVVLAGGVASFSSSQELSKLLRDASIIDPSIVISYSGVNNIYLLKDHPFLNEYQLEICKFLEDYSRGQKKLPGIISRSIHHQTTAGMKLHKNSIDKYTYWLNHEKLMKYACDLYGSCFMCFLQPNLLSMEKDEIGPDGKEYLLNRSFIGTYGMTPDMYSETAREFRRRIRKDKDEDWLYDLSDVFNNRLEGIYLDAIHLSEKGNRIIAEEITNKVIKTFNYDRERKE
jgi:hypothetical protein